MYILTLLILANIITRKRYEYADNQHFKSYKK